MVHKSTVELDSSLYGQLLEFLCKHCSVPLQLVPNQHEVKLHVTEKVQAHSGPEALKLFLEQYGASVAGSSNEFNMVLSWVKEFSEGKKTDPKMLNSILARKVVLIGVNLTAADFALYLLFRSIVTGWNAEERLQYCNITRWFDYVQHNQKVFDVVPIQTSLPNSQQKVAAAPAVSTSQQQQPQQAQQQQQQQQQKQKKQQDQKKTQQPTTTKTTTTNAASQDDVAPVARIEFRVGYIKEASKHPNADGLYVEKIDIGEQEPRTVVSGLVKWMPVENLVNRKVICICNLKPVTFRGVKSFAMVLCASTETQLEFVDPPAEAKPGDLVTVKGLTPQPDAQLPPKKKIFETVAPGLKTDDSCIATYEGTPLVMFDGAAAGQVCRAASIVGGNIK